MLPCVDIWVKDSLSKHDVVFTKSSHVEQWVLIIVLVSPVVNILLVCSEIHLVDVDWELEVDCNFLGQDKCEDIRWFDFTHLHTQCLL